MTDNRHSITSSQLMAFIISSQVGIGIITLPSQLAAATGNDGWICVLLTGGVSLVVGWCLLFFLKRYKNKSILEINKLLYGKYFSLILNSILFLYLSFAACVGVRLFGEFVKITLLPRTPPLLLAYFILIPTIYITWFGLKPVSRFLYIMYPILFIMFVYILFITREVRLSFMLPLVEQGFSSLLAGMKVSFFAFIGFELIIFIYPNISEKEKTMKYFFSAIIISMIFFAYIVFMSDAILGENMLKALTLPVFSLTRIFNAPILERVDLYFIALWFIAMANSIRTYFFTAYYSITIILHIKERKLFYILYAITVILVSRIPKDLNEVFRYAETLSTASISVIAFFLFSLIFSFIRRKGVVKND